MTYAKDNCYITFVKLVRKSVKLSNVRVISLIAQDAILELLKSAGCDASKLIPGRIFIDRVGSKQPVLNKYFWYIVLDKNNEADKKATYWLDQIVIHTLSFLKKNNELPNLSIAKEVRRQAKAVPIALIQMPTKK